MPYKPLVLQKLRVQADQVVRLRGGAYFGGVLISNSGGAASVVVYEGLNATIGDLLDRFDAAAASTRAAIEYQHGRRIREQLFIDIGSNVDAFWLLFLTAEDLEALGIG